MSVFGLFLVQMRESADHKNFKYGKCTLRHTNFAANQILLFFDKLSATGKIRLIPTHSTARMLTIQ